MVDISALIPAYNEEKTITKTVHTLKKISQIDEILVIDDGSQDNTPALAEKAGASVIRLAQNEGKGKAIWAGLRVAKHDVLLFADADLGESAGEMAKLIPPVAEDKAVMTIARFSKPVERKGGFGFVKLLAYWGIKLYTGYNVQSPLSGQRVLRRLIIEEYADPPLGFGLEVYLTINCLTQGHKIQEIPVDMSHRETGRDWASFKHRGKQFRHIAGELWRLRGKRRGRARWMQLER